MSHSLIIGVTESGKTTLAKILAKKYRNKKIPVLVLDPFKASSWPASFVTDDPEKFLRVAKKSRSCALFIDECGSWMKKCSEVLTELATTSRHYGHNCHFISQRGIQLSPTIRTQCPNIFLFKQSLQDTKDLSAEFVAEKLMEAHTLKKGEYLGKIGVDGAVFKGRVF